MNSRLISSLVAAAAIVFLGAGALGSAITPQPLKVIATVVARPHAEAHWYARGYAHGL